MSHELGLSGEGSGDASEHDVIEALTAQVGAQMERVVFQPSENLNYVGQVKNGGRLVDADTDKVIVHLPQVDVVLVELGKELVRAREP